MRFQGKTVIVTGGTSGLGEAVVKAFACEGASVHFCGLIDQEGERVEQSTQTLAGSATYYNADVRIESHMKEMVAAVVKKTGKLDIAVNNAGISHPAARFADQDTSIVADVMQTNLMGVWFAMRHEILAMKAANSGAIINIASILSKSGAEWMAAYGASKHAVIGLTKSAALDYVANGIRINAVSPGPMQTPMLDRAIEDIGGDMSKYAGGFPKSGPAKPEEVAQTILYLASSEAGYTTGANIVVDGGVSSG
ncbi:SDR family NAD(P)-dependent oxidoreductase [Kordiimonas pumila]|uniref:SDR family NAD(P)-dependent oxidoreductase n=1 Tax=Kordiimonas pumila TaxID=2161677 RepID=A0ABV7D5B1_9PROT|nr:SDR family oxidoreductase [Kordiimonas pumila]